MAPDDETIVIATMSRKGGAGKTTIVRALASAMAHKKKKVMLVDADPSRALAEWIERAKRFHTSSPYVSVTEMTNTDELPDIIENASGPNKHDFIIIDTPGLGGKWADIIAQHSNILVTPVILSETDLGRARDTYSWYLRLFDRTSEPDLLPDHVTVVTRYDPRIRDKKEILRKTQQKLLNAAETEMGAIPVRLRERPAFQDMDTVGLLGGIIEKMQADESVLVQGHARRFEIALDEATDLLNAILDKAAADKARRGLA